MAYSTFHIPPLCPRKHLQGYPLQYYCESKKVELTKCLPVKGNLNEAWNVDIIEFYAISKRNIVSTTCNDIDSL